MSIYSVSLNIFSCYYGDVCCRIDIADPADNCAMVYSLKLFMLLHIEQLEYTCKLCKIMQECAHSGVPTKQKYLVFASHFTQNKVSTRNPRCNLSIDIKDH